jgi:hypothetical protein
MDLLAIILSAIGWEKDRSLQASDRKVEAYRLVSEVAAECMRTIQLLNATTPGIERRLSAAFPEYPEVIRGCREGLAKMLSDTTQLQAMAESYKPMIQNASTRADWETGLMKLHEWRSTASGLYPYAETMIGRIEKLLAEAEHGTSPQEPISSMQKVVAFRDRNRGFDAPPL